MLRRFYKRFELLNGGDGSKAKVAAASCSKTVQLAGRFSLRPAELEQSEIRRVWSDWRCCTFTGSGWPHLGHVDLIWVDLYRLWKQQAAQWVYWLLEIQYVLIFKGPVFIQEQQSTSIKSLNTVNWIRLIFFFFSFSLPCSLFRWIGFLLFSCFVFGLSINK